MNVKIPADQKIDAYFSFLEEYLTKEIKDHKIVRWHISSINSDKSANAEIVYLRPQENEDLGNMSVLDDVTVPPNKEEPSTSPQKNDGLMNRRDSMKLFSAGMFPMMLAASYDSDPYFSSQDDPWSQLAKVIQEKVVQTEQGLLEQTRKINDQVYIQDKKKKGEADKLAKPNYVPSKPITQKFAEELNYLPEKVLKTRFNKNIDFKSDVQMSIDKLSPFFFKQNDPILSLKDLTNQTYFNFVAYNQWRVIAKNLPTKKERKEFTLALGEEMLKGPLKSADIEIFDARKEGLEKVLKNIRKLLQCFKDEGFIESYSLDDDSLVDGAWDIGGQGQFNLMVVREAVMSAKMLLEYEGTRMTPDYLNGAILAYLQRCNTSPQYEQYYIDDTYRPNTDDYTPSQVLISITLNEEE